MAPTNKEKYRRDLLNNIKFIQSFAPDFSMTDEQIEYMLSDEKIEMHEKYKGQNILSESKERSQIVDSYTPRYHDAFDRHAKWLVHKDDTQENKEYNKKLLNNLGRDDEIGVQASEDYLLNAFNVIDEVDISKFSDNVPFEEFMEYASKNTGYGKAVMETEHLLSQYTAVKPKPESQEKIRAIYNFGSNVGAVLGSATELVGNEAFLTLPVEFLNDKQYNQLLNEMVHEPQMVEKYGVTYAPTYKSWLSNKKDVQKDYENYRKYINKGDKITIDEFNYVEPKESLVGGGYLGRRDTVLQTIEKNSSYEELAGIEQYQDVVSKGKEFKELIESLGTKVPSAEEQSELTKAASQYSRAIYNFTKSKEITASQDPKISEIGDTMKASMLVLKGYSDKKLLRSNARYYAEDLQKGIQAEKDTNKAAYIKELTHLVKQLKKTEGNWTANSPAYDKFSKLLKALPDKLNNLKGFKDVTFEKIQEAFKPVVDAANEYAESHSSKKLNSRQFNRLKIMNRLKDLSKEATQKSNTPGEDLDYRLAEKIYTANAIKCKKKQYFLDDAVREQGIKTIMKSKLFKNDIMNISKEAKEKLLKVPGEKVLDRIIKAYNKAKQSAKQKNVEVKKNADSRVL